MNHECMILELNNHECSKQEHTVFGRMLSASRSAGTVGGREGGTEGGGSQEKSKFATLYSDRTSS